MKPTLLMLKGLPASGKSTHAFELVSKGWKRVNKDDLRAMIDGKLWSRKNEKEIKAAEIVLAQNFLIGGFNVVVDDTNFAHEDMWRHFAEQNGAEFSVKFFDTPLAECIERDAKRGEKCVGAKVIYRMYEQYLKPKVANHDPKKVDCYIFDIDGTLAHSVGRSPYDYTQVGTDVPYADIVRIYKMIKGEGYDIFILSGRNDVCRTETENWLWRNGITGYNSLLMRKSDDSRKDAIVKRELYENHIKQNYSVLGVFDDRNQVVDMWRSLGLTCLQVGYGYF